MKNPNDTKTNMKKQLASGGAYIALAVTIVAVTVSTISSNFSENGKEKNLAVNDNKGTTLYNSELPDIPQIDISDFTFDTPVSENPGGVSAEVVEKAEDVKEDAEMPIDSTGNDDEDKTGNLNPQEETPAKPDKSKPVPEEPSSDVFVPGYDGFISPVAGYISKEYSIEVPVYSATMYDYRTHSGIDITSEIGTPVRAVSNGVIEDIYQDVMFGTTVVISHEDGVSSIYSNLSEELPSDLTVGKNVATGDILGGVGQSALCEWAEASHLHFEMKKDGNSVNPSEYIPD